MYPRFIIVNPALKAPSVAGKNEKAPKIAPAGFMNMPMIDPINTDVPPAIGPRIIPIRGALITPSVIEPETPIAIVYGSYQQHICTICKS